MATFFRTKGFFIILGLMIVILPLLSVMVYQLSMKQKKKTSLRRFDNTNVKTTFISIRTYLTIFRIFRQAYFTEKVMGKIYKRLGNIAFTDEVELKVMTVRLAFLTYVCPAVVLVVATFLLHDILTAMMMAFLITVAINNLVDKTITQRYMKMLTELTIFISDLRQEYSKTYSVMVSLQKLTPHPVIADQIYAIQEIIEEGSDRKKLDKFLMDCSMRLIQTLAGVCYLCEESGDVTLADGTSNFIRSLTFIMAEANQEIRKINLINLKFSGLDRIPLMSLLFIPAMSGALTNFVFPSSSIILNGMIGYIARVFIMLHAIYEYNFVITSNDPISLSSNDRKPFIDDLQKKKWFRWLNGVFIAKKSKHVKKKTKLLKLALSRQDLKYMYSEKIVSAFVAFALIHVIFVSAIVIGRSFEKSNIEPILLISQNYDDETKSRLKDLDASIVGGKDIPEEVLIQEIMKILKARSENDQKVQVELERIKQKQDSLGKPIYPVWVLWIAITCALIAYRFPEHKLKRRIKTIQEEEFEDCLQMQTLICILMNTSIDTLDLLKWLSVTSKVHSNLLVDAYHEYTANPELALSRLRDRSRSPEMKRMSSKLMSTIEAISIAEAFSDLIPERDHIMRTLEDNVRDIITKRAVKASSHAGRVIYSVIALIVILPIVMLSFGQFKLLKSIGIF